MHNNLDGEVAIQHANDLMCSNQALYNGARIQETGLCLSVSRHPRAQLCNIPQKQPPDSGNYGDEEEVDGHMVVAFMNLFTDQQCSAGPGSDASTDSHSCRSSHW